MTLEEAIEHCKEITEKCTNKECALDHQQLCEWLMELQKYRDENLQREKSMHLALKDAVESIVDQCVSSKLSLYVSESEDIDYALLEYGGKNIGSVRIKD